MEDDRRVWYFHQSSLDLLLFFALDLVARVGVKSARPSSEAVTLRTVQAAIAGLDKKNIGRRLLLIYPEISFDSFI